MTTPNFNINEFSGNFQKLNDFQTELYKKNILSKDYVEDNLFLVYNKFDNHSSSTLEKECRSIILNRDNVISLVLSKY